MNTMAPILIIDAGHGGADPGGGSNAQFTEKEMTLRISLYQYRRFQELNIPAALTRSSDVTLSSDARAALVRNSGARYCISNHINAGGGRGAEVIYSIYAKPDFAQTILDQLKTTGMPVRRIYTRTLPDNPRLDYYFMHRETGSVETVIVEYGFADNPLDASKLAADWEQLAEAVVKAFCLHANYAYNPPDAPTPAPGEKAEDPANGGGSHVPDWKKEAIEWLFKQGFLTDESWRGKADQPLPLWAEALVLRRMYEKLAGSR